MSNTEKTVKIVFIEHNGIEYIVEAKVGATVMQAAVNNLVLGIKADCGGLCACATCHGYVDTAWLEKIPPQSRGEADLLASVSELQAESRLTCQIQIDEELDGIVVRLPKSQY